MKCRDRIQFIDRQFATIRYIGPIKEWGDVTALGIEWDDPERGKNNGSVGGIEYFKTRRQGAGTFIKSNNKKVVQKRSTFNEALIESYGVSGNQIDDIIRIGSKEVENYGFEKLNNINADFERLISVTLDFKGIYAAGDVGLVSSMKALVKLDLSYNLVNDTGEIWQIIDKVPQLRYLNLNGNRFEEEADGVGRQPEESIEITDVKYGRDGDDRKEHNLECLHLAGTKVSIQFLTCSILPKFPCLKELILASNEYTDDDMDMFGKEVSRTIEMVDVSFNCLTKVPYIGVRNINLSNNLISHSPGLVPFEILDLRYNSISSWEVIEALSESKIRELRINDNPLFGTNEDEMTINIIARFDCTHRLKNDTGLCNLNGSDLTSEEITNAELYFISKVQKGDYVVNKQGKNWNRLIQKYNVSDRDQGVELNPFAYNKIKLNIYNNGELILSKYFLKDQTILKLKGAVSKALNVSILKFVVYYDVTPETRERLDDDNARIQDFAIENGENVYVGMDTLEKI